jgi:hypothetical protein
MRPNRNSPWHDAWHGDRALLDHPTYSFEQVDAILVAAKDLVVIDRYKRIRTKPVERDAMRQPLIGVKSGGREPSRKA